MTGGKSNGVDPTGWARAPLEPAGPLHVRIMKAIYNKDEKTFLGRTAKRWGIVVLFYSVFYAALAVLFAVCWAGLMASLDDKRPTYTLDKSLIGSSPGLAYRPQPPEKAKQDKDQSLFMWAYNKTDPQTYEAYFNRTQEFFTANPQLIENQTECTASTNYGWPEAPCFFIKLNKIIDWVPDCYEDPSSFAEDMPQELKEYIETEADKKQVWMSCAERRRWHAANASDVAAVSFPWGPRGLPAAAFPFTNLEPLHQFPLVAIQIKVDDAIIESKGPEGVTFDVECRAWAKNIHYYHPDGLGFIQIRMQVKL